jgi:transposase-like protein
MTKKRRTLWKVPTNIATLTNNYGSWQKVYQLYCEYGILEAAMSCKKCGKPMRLIRNKSFKADLHCWKCNSCNSKTTIRKGSWLDNSNLSLFEHLKLIYYFLTRYSQESAAHELGRSCQTVNAWYQEFQDLCLDEVMEQRQQIGGVGKIVEIDESKFVTLRSLTFRFGKRKYNKGRRVDGTWVFGGVERSDDHSAPVKAFFYPVARRDKDTLLACIKENILPGTTIYSDCWKSYDCLSDNGYTHLTVNHSVNFVDPTTGAHTNTIESNWRSVKASLPRFGTTRNRYFSYTGVWVWAHGLVGKDLLHEFLSMVPKHYTLNGQVDESFQ